MRYASFGSPAHCPTSLTINDGSSRISTRPAAHPADPGSAFGNIPYLLSPPSGFAQEVAVDSTGVYFAGESRGERESGLLKMTPN